MKKLFTLSILLFFVFGLSGCLEPEDKTELEDVTTPSSDEGESNFNVSDEASTSGSLKILLTDAPAEEVYEAVYVVFEKVEVHMAKGGVSESGEDGEGDSEGENEWEENAGEESENTEENKNGVEESCDSDSAVYEGEDEEESYHIERSAFRKAPEKDDWKMIENPDDESLYEDEVFSKGNGSWITIKSAEENDCYADESCSKINLLDLTNGKFEQLGVANILPGKYTQIRITVKLATVVINGEEIEMKLPSRAVKIVRPFTVEAGVTTELVADFDAAKSIHKRGTDEYIMSPVIRLVENKATGAITGDVVGDAEQVIVTSMVDGSRESYSGTVADDDGYFKLAFLEPGVYDILIESFGFHSFSIEDVEVKAGETTALPEPFELLAREFAVVE